MPDEYRNQIVTGDARVLAERIPDESVALCLHDPPFGIGFKYENGYDDDPASYPELLKWTIRESSRIVKPGGLCFVYVAQPQLRDVYPLFPDGSRIFAACKNFVQMRPCPVQYAYDPVVFWDMPGDSLKEYKGRDWHVGNTANTNGRGLGDAKGHGCPRPLDTIIYMVKNFCPEGGAVADFFLGSGTTAVAAKIAGRKWIGFEIMPDTARQARQRVEDVYPLFVPEPEQLTLALHQPPQHPHDHRPFVVGELGEDAPALGEDGVGGIARCGRQVAGKS